MEPSVFSLPANQNRRAARARRATETVVKSIPEILRHSPRARHGIQHAELIVDPPPAATQAPAALGASAPPPWGPRIRLSSADTLTAAGKLSERPFASAQAGHAAPNVAVLNMASPFQPGGGFLDGANSQEEFLCHRTTLYPSLSDAFYRLPEVSGVYTPEVLVFRDATPEANDLPKRDTFFVDVITAGAFKFPDVRRGRSDDRLDGACSCGISYCDRDRDLVARKMRAVLRIAQRKGAEKLILGAWGCGAFGNPVRDVAKLWRKVIAGNPRQRRPNAEQWEGIQEVIFAVPDPIMLREFQRAFDDIADPVVLYPDADDGAAGADREAGSREREVAELVLRVQETEMQIEQMTNPRTKARLRAMLSLLNTQLAQGRASKDEDVTKRELHDADEQVDNFVVAGIPGSDEEDCVYVVDNGSPDSADCPIMPAYEFRPPPPGLDGHASYDEDEDTADDSFFPVKKPSPRFDPATGWFSGSIDEFHGLLRGHGKPSRDTSHTSPMLRPDSREQSVIDEMSLNNCLDQRVAAGAGR